jgi:hypothetical protein
MLITNSKYKDYYDGVAGTTGIDKTIVYDRTIIEYEEKNIGYGQKVFPNDIKNYTKVFEKLNNTTVKKDISIIYKHIQPFIVGFCGKLYIGWKLYSEGKKILNGKELITTISYDNENIKELVKKYSYGGYFEDNLKYILSYDPIEIFRTLNTPVFIYDSDYNRTSWNKHLKNCPIFIVNPLLKEYQFYKIFDAVQAFQEISMFIGGVLGSKEKEIIQISDKNKIESHGFDKWSFRKEKEI